jgi:fluoroquinolone resistance protein
VEPPAVDFSIDKQTEHREQVFKRVAYHNKTLNGRAFYDCTFVHCNFQESVLQNCKFRNCTFQDCDLRLMKVPGSSFRNTVFDKSKVVGVNWAEGSWSKSGLLESIGFTECDISYSTFIGLELPKLVLTKCTAKNADFAEANLSGADCTYTDFAESRFLHTNLTEADFTHARNYAIDVYLNTIKQARFSLPAAVDLLRFMNIVLVE